MTEQELSKIRDRWVTRRYDHEIALPMDACEVIDTLIRAIDERDAIIHYLQLDGQALARMAEQRFIAELVEWVVAEKDKHNTDHPADFGAAATLGCVLGYLHSHSAFGSNDPSIDPLPPDQARAEAERLRKEVERLTNLLEQKSGCEWCWGRSGD